MTHTVFIEVGPLQEIRYAGISNVTLNLCRYWLQQPREASCFFLGPYLIDRGALEIVVEARSGGLFQQLLIHKQAIAGFVANEVKRRPTPVALFPNVKSVEGVFGLSFQIVHDISFLVTPEFHHADTLAYHGLAILKDLGTNAHTFCVSHATAGDLTTYLGVPADRITVIYPGADPPPEVDRYTQNLPDAAPSRPYIVVPGTIEPRKNIDLVLLGLQRIPQLLARYDWVFIGSPGWLIAFGDRIAQYGLSDHYRSGAIKWLGYVDEFQKAFLYRHAETAIYPSFFEGFGIPVVEAMYYGCPVVCSYSSAIPEAGGDAAFYFDPTSLLSFEQTLLSALRRLRLERESIRAASCRQASRFTWHDFGRKTAEAIARTVAENARESQILNTDEIVGFPKPRAEKSTHQGTAMSGAGFDLVDELRRVKRAEIARITELAERLLIQFGPVIAIGFLYYEMLGRPPDGAVCVSHIERLGRAPSTAAGIVEELRALADSESRNPVQPA
jgi:glycosyltransferase involved in cell wall biosynthesis